MADVRLRAVIEAEDRASRVFSGVEKQTESLRSRLSSVAATVGTVTAAFGIVSGGLAFVMKTTTDASNLLSNSLIGLNSVANALGQNAGAAKLAAQELASDGLLSVRDAAEGLKNLLATGFSLPESIKLMNGLKDAAAFNRQGMLGFGEAVVGATQGLKNQNSIMVDNAGITKNLSVILREAGFSQNDLNRVTTDATVRTALYNGILKEATLFQGDATRASETLSGQQAKLATQIFLVKAAIGDALAPTVQWIITQIEQWISSVGGPAGIRRQVEEFIPIINALISIMSFGIKVVASYAGAFMDLANAIGEVIFQSGRAITKLGELASKAKEGIGSIAGGISGAVSGAASTAASAIGRGLSVFGFANGGIVRSPTLGLVGEAGPEAIIPLDRAGGLGPTINVTITGNMITDRIGLNAIADAVGDTIVRKLRLATAV